MDNTTSSMITALIEAGSIDTLYRDVYLDRARALLEPVLTLPEFHRLEHQRAELDDLPATIERELDKGNWSLVKALSQRMQALKHAMDDKGALLETARGVYVRDVRLDPFSRGLEPFTRIPKPQLARLGSRLLELLGTLERADPVWKDFYATRHGKFESRLRRMVKQDGDVLTSSATEPLEAARRALKAGDMNRLAALVDALSGEATTDPSASRSGTDVGSALAEGEPDPELLPAPYPGEAVTRARPLGLASRHLEPRVEVAALRRYAWTPSSDRWGPLDPARLPPLPAASPAGLAEALEVFRIHPLINSGGARYLPGLVAEDVLVEDFPEPAEGEAPPASELVKSLGLPGRRGLPRTVIEQALLVHGGRILDGELGLDPRVFRLVCIPPDVYVRLGEAEGWGRQQCWTHFDGYLIRTVAGQVRLQALAGGDVRYGGLFDLLGVARDYDSDRLLARFAVVQRARMTGW